MFVSESIFFTKSTKNIKKNRQNGPFSIVKLPNSYIYPPENKIRSPRNLMVGRSFIWFISFFEMVPFQGGLSFIFGEVYICNYIYVYVRFMSIKPPGSLIVLPKPTGKGLLVGKVGTHLKLCEFRGRNLAELQSSIFKLWKAQRQWKKHVFSSKNVPISCCCCCCCCCCKKYLAAHIHSFFLGEKNYLHRPIIRSTCVGVKNGGNFCVFSMGIPLPHQEAKKKVIWNGPLDSTLESGAGLKNGGNHPTKTHLERWEKKLQIYKFPPWLWLDDCVAVCTMAHWYAQCFTECLQ